MLKFRKDVVHQLQLKPFNCGAVALQCVFDEPIDKIEDTIGCTKNGTRTWRAFDGLRSEKINCSIVEIGADHSNHSWWLETCSYRWPIYIGCHFVNQGKRGRPSNSHHAVLFANGMCYDGNEKREEPIAAIALKFNKKFVIRDIIIIEHELPNWRKNLETS